MALVLALIGCLIKIFIFPTVVERDTDPGPIPDAAKAAVSEDVKNFVTQRDKKGIERLIFEDNQKVLASANLTDSAEVFKKKYLEQLDINQDQARTISMFNATIGASKLPAQKVDSGFRYSDRNLSIDFVFNKDSINKGHFNYQYNANINYAEYSKKSWIFGKKKDYVQFWIEDPKATINGAKRLVFEHKQPKASVDVSLAAMHVGNIYGGPLAEANIGNMAVGLGYFYDFERRSWFAPVTVKYRLARF